MTNGIQFVCLFSYYNFILEYRWVRVKRKPVLRTLYVNLFTVVYIYYTDKSL